MATTTASTFEKLYRQLNPEQREAVDAIEGVVMVLAGPGTGKTQTLALRIAKILQETQMDPYNILCLTFTESGVAAMRKRLISIIGTTAYYVRIHTFHSFCNEIIQEYPEKFSFARELEVLSEIERVQLYREIIDGLPATSPLKPFGAPYLYLPDIITDVQQLKQEHITGERYAEVLAALEQLTSQMKAAITEFVAQKPSARNPQALYNKVMDGRTTWPQLASTFLRVEKIFTKYSAHATAAENAREVQKLATKFKTDIKRWYDSLANRLPKQYALKEVYEAYQQKLKERGRYDYEDMLLFVVEKFKTDDELLARYQEQFQYILVDEYQDTNGAQNETVALLASWHDNPNVFVVGDDKQSIYRFQGASLENLLYLYQRYQTQAKVVVLEQNYRSQQAILDAAYGLINQNEERLDRYIPGTTKALQAATVAPTIPVEVYELDNPQAEAFFIAKQIQQLLTAGVAPGEIAVLYRRNADAGDLADTLLALQIPVQVERGDNVLDDPIVQQFLEVLQYLSTPTRQDVLWRILHYPFFKIDQLDLIRLQSYAARAKIDLFTALSTEEHLAAAKVKTPVTWQALAEKLAHWQMLLVTIPLQDFLAHMLQESGLFEYVLTSDDHVEALNRINALFTEAKLLNRRQRQLTLADFLQHVALLREHNLSIAAKRVQTKVAAVSLMTAHRAKGLEFEHVFITRAINHHWGNLREHSRLPLPQGLLKFDRVAGEENNEDERRLFYVAMTRAKRKLYITYASHSEEGREQVPSIFLEELPADVVVRESRDEATPETSERLRQLAVQPKRVANSRDLHDFLQGLLARYALSATHLNDYLECPRLFYYQDLLRVPHVPNKHMAFGTAVHNALYAFCAVATPTQLPAKEELLDFFTRELHREMLNEVDYADSLVFGTGLLGDYYDFYHASMCRQSLLEYSFASHGVTLDNIPLTGKIDKVEILDPAARLVNVVDYKTGNPDGRSSDLKSGGKYHRQLTFYKMLCDSSPRFTYTMQSGEIDFIQKSPTKGTYLKKKIAITNADVAALEKVIKQMWDDVTGLKFLEWDEDKFCGECTFCLLMAHGRSH